MASEKNIVALEMGAQSVGGAVFSRGKGDQLILDAYHSVDLVADPAADGTQSEQLKGAIKELVKTLKVKGADVRFAVSSQSVFTRFVTLPPLDVDQVEEIVGFEAKQQVPFPIEEAVWDYQSLGDDMEAVIVAIKSDDLDEVNDAVRAQGLETVTVDLASMALYNAFRYNYPDLDQPAVLIDIGARTTNLIYIEGSKVFMRSVNVGGRDITQAIANEFGISFQEAEERKIQDGFVALGGGFADDENPEIAAMSKVIRQAATRLHSEVSRTNNHYRSNQGGSMPTIAFLCGSGAGLPYLNEFFKEKLNIQVEYFNSLRNVQVGKRADHNSVGQKAHALGELVGLGLRGLGNCPMEIDLVPRVIQRERDLKRRAPFFWMSGLTAVAMIAASGVFFQMASTHAVNQTSDLNAKVNGLQKVADQVTAQEERLEKIRQRADPYSQAAKDRVYWITTLNELNDKLVEDKVWLVEVQPLTQGKSLLAEPFKEGDVTAATREEALAGAHVIDSILFKGLWRENPKGADVVGTFIDNLRESNNYFFDLVERDEDGQPVLTNGRRTYLQSNSQLFPGVNDPGVVGIDYGASGDKHAYTFHMVLPLPEWRQIQFRK